MKHAKIAMMLNQNQGAHLSLKNGNSGFLYCTDEVDSLCFVSAASATFWMIGKGSSSQLSTGTTSSSVLSYIERGMSTVVGLAA